MNWLGIVAFRNQGINEVQGVAFEGKVEFDCRVVTPQPSNYPWILAAPRLQITGLIVGYGYGET